MSWKGSEAEKECKRRWKKNHPEQAKKDCELYRQRHPDKRHAQYKNWRERNLEKTKSAFAEWQQIHRNERSQSEKERWMARGKNSYLKRLYGITLDEYMELFVLQEGKCAICGKHQSELKKSLSVDHNHITGKIRGLLCSNCNYLLGMCNDDADRLNKAIAYLLNEEIK